MLVAAGTHLRAGHDWFSPTMRPRARADAGRQTAGDATRIGRRERRSVIGRTADAVALVDPRCRSRRRAAPSPRSASTGSDREAGRLYSASTRSPIACEFHSDESRASPSAKARPRRRILESLNTASCAPASDVSRRDNGYAISTPVEVQTPAAISRASSSTSRARGIPLRRHRLRRKLSHDAGPV